MVSPNAPENAPRQFAAVIIESNAVRWVGPIGYFELIALSNCAIEDPATWQDVVLLWERHRFIESITEFAESLPSRTLGLDDAVAALGEMDAWLVLDLVQRRMIASHGYGEAGLEALANASSDLDLDDEDWDDDANDSDIYGDDELEFEDDDGLDDAPEVQVEEDVQTLKELSERIVLPPWWERCSEALPEQLRERRSTPLVIPRARRDVLWGPPMRHFFATAILSAVRAGRPWLARNRDGQPIGSYSLAIEIHRDWLMTPREDLGGATPRDLLHGAMTWVDGLSALQAHRVYAGQAPIPISTELSTYGGAPPGRHEVIMYFEACREALAAGWDWLLEDPTRADLPNAADELAAAMEQRLQAWLNEPFEDGASPGDVIQSDRLRIPLVEEGGHMIDCDCPLCQMMAEGAFGPSIVHYDGHQLELDNEFAFSLCADRETWETERLQWQESTDGGNDGGVDSDVDAEATDGEGQIASESDDELASPWKRTFVADDPHSGGDHSLWGLAFFMAEVVGTLKEIGAPQADVDELNRIFREFRHAASPAAVHTAAGKLLETLEGFAQQHEQLVGRSADLQSRVQEYVRYANENPDRSDDIPF